MNTQRLYVDLDGDRINYLAARDGRPVLLLHGTFWSRVWEPVLPILAAAGLAPLAPDFPGFGCSGGELDVERATVPALAAWSQRLVEALGADEPFAVAGHDIGGAVAQHLAVRHSGRVQRLALVNSVLYDSWPVPAVARFRDPSVRAATTVDLLQARDASLAKAVAHDLTAEEKAAWLAPWRQPARTRSWMAMAAAADARYTLELVDELRGSHVPLTLLWGADDEFQPISYAQRLSFVAPRARLIAITDARHIPMEDEPNTVGHGLVDALAGEDAPAGGGQTRHQRR